MSSATGLRCRHAFEALAIHANGEAVCSIVDGRGDFVLGNVHHDSLQQILSGPRLRELRRSVLSTASSFCPAVGRNCPLKNIPVGSEDGVQPALRFLMIEPTTACDLRCLACPVRDIAGDTTWRDAYRDGGLGFMVWDGVRRSKQHAAGLLRRLLPGLDGAPARRLGRIGAAALRGRMAPSRGGTLPIDVLKRVVTEAGGGLERVDLFNYGEPFLYRDLIEALRHIRRVTPPTGIAISTDGLRIGVDVEKAIVRERLLDWIIFSVDGIDAATYGRYRIRGSFETAFANMLRFNERARGSAIKVVWQYVVFRWNDSDAHLQRAIAMAADAGLRLQFDFASTWGRSRRRASELEYLRPYLRPYTALPGERRQGGW